MIISAGARIFTWFHLVAIPGVHVLTTDSP